MTTRDWALLYGSLGWRVFPVAAGEKRPMYRGWQRDATTDPEQIARYWRVDPGPNIGVVCGEAFDAFDIEAAHLPLVRWWADTSGHRIPETPIARTGRGGIHLLVAPTGVGRGGNLHLEGTHVGELKSIGGFIVVCPSVTVLPYRWVRSPDVQPLAPAPAWLRALLDRPVTRRRRRTNGGSDPRRKRRQLDVLADAIATAGTGRRNNILYWAIRRADEEGIRPRDAASALGRSAVVAGLDEREVSATIRSALRASRR